MRLIDKDALIDAVEGAINVLELHGVSRIFTSVPLAIIKGVPAIDAEPVVHGRWGEKQDCSVCGFRPWYERDIHTLSYCPNCGAKMDGGGSDGEFS